MDEIERKVRLPKGAEPLTSYARTYAYSLPHTIEARYFLPDPKPDVKTCEEAKSYGLWNGQIAYLCPPPSGMAKDERRWLDSPSVLVDMTDGGCGLINLSYDTETKTITSVECDGTL
ncbi:hypothetical protein [Novosphingobium naphthalenivorans]|uniref:hypothetical protein n=1 Tax=Novosphingobium naphthalenivorans TaxID=273168 RepID=UPI0012ED1F49|nr:hypothetical protein [Novosphingobium naphthalenivorans]